MGIQCLVDLVQYQNMEIFKISVLLLILAHGNLACLVRETKVFQPPKPSKFDRNVHISEVNLPKKKRNRPSTEALKIFGNLSTLVIRSLKIFKSLMNQKLLLWTISTSIERLVNQASI